MLDTIRDMITEMLELDAKEVEQMRADLLQEQGSLDARCRSSANAPGAHRRPSRASPLTRGVRPEPWAAA